ncbi:MAG: DUF2520 domain-containing protein [Bacteroidota bacterium]|nr:DUF2520 domain-containing protein [Bacteroidota bacterium]
MIKIVLIGSGKLAFNFQKIFSRCSEINLIQWYSRKINLIKSFENETSITDSILELKSADIYIIAVSDDAIAHISKKIKTTALVVHCSGGVSMDEMRCEARKGVLYPLQTFSKKLLTQFNNLPILIEAEKKEDFKLLQDLVYNIGGKPFAMNSQKRSYVHLIAVIINNFGNHLIEIGENIAKSHDLPFSIFHSLLEQTYKNGIENGAKYSQTGPAKRKDFKTINKHLDLISNEKIKQLYLDLTNSIQRRHD